MSSEYPVVTPTTLIIVSMKWWFAMPVPFMPPAARPELPTTSTDPNSVNNAVDCFTFGDG